MAGRCFDSGLCQRDPLAIPPNTMNCSMSGQDATTTTISSAGSTNPRSHPSHATDKTKPPVNLPTSTTGCSTCDTTCGSPDACPCSSNLMNKLHHDVHSERSESKSVSSAQISYDGSGSPTYTSQPSRMTPGHHASTNTVVHSCDCMTKLDLQYVFSTSYDAQG